MLEARAHHSLHGPPYHYIPTRWIAILYIVLYGISTRTFLFHIIGRLMMNVFCLSSHPFGPGREVSHVVASTHSMFVWVA